MKLHHIAFWTRDIERLEDFYIRYFDGRVLFRHSIDDFRCVFLEVSGSVKLELMTRGELDGPDSKEKVGYSHISLELDSRETVNELTDFFRSEGIVLEKEKEQYDDGFYESSVRDPDGNIIELAFVDRNANPDV